mmetsp:Transcript_22209/g.62486  ORF Transcript_22209/g.62486 Transcript_22209/m.62486 type:complete len:239 (-) Transcript_22209:288-1004(-)
MTSPLSLPPMRRKRRSTSFSPTQAASFASAALGAPPDVGENRKPCKWSCSAIGNAFRSDEIRSARWTPISLRYKPANSTTSRAAVATLPKMLRPSQNRLYAVFVLNTSNRDSAPPTSVCMPVPSGLTKGRKTRYHAATREDHTTIDASGLLMRLNTYDCGHVERQWSQSFDCVLPEASATGAKPPGLLISRSRPKDEPSSSSLVVATSSTTGISSAKYGSMLLRAPKRPDGAAADAAA